MGQYRFLYTFRISDAEDTFRTVGALFFVDAHFYTPFAPLVLACGNNIVFLYTFRISDAEDTFRTVGALFFVDAHFYTPFAPLVLACGTISFSIHLSHL